MCTWDNTGMLNLMKKSPKKYKCAHCGFKEFKIYYDKNGNYICDYCKNGNDPTKRKE